MIVDWQYFSSDLWRRSQIEGRGRGGIGERILLVLAKRKNLHSPSHPSTASRTIGDQCTSEKQKYEFQVKCSFYTSFMKPPPYNFSSRYIQTENVSIFDQPVEKAEERKWKYIVKSSYLTFTHWRESLCWLGNNWINMKATFWARPYLYCSQGSGCVTQSGHQVKTDHNILYCCCTYLIPKCNNTVNTFPFYLLIHLFSSKTTSLRLTFCVFYICLVLQRKQ